MTYFLWLALAVLIEAPILWLILRQPLLRTLIYALLINGITHPIAWWFVRIHGISLWMVEIAVAIVEAVLILLAFRVSLRRAFISSVAANMVSAGVGVVISLILQ